VSVAVCGRAVVQCWVVEGYHHGAHQHHQPHPLRLSPAAGAGSMVRRHPLDTRTPARTHRHCTLTCVRCTLHARCLATPQADPELEAIRQRRMAELMAKQGVRLSRDTSPLARRRPHGGDVGRWRHAHTRCSFLARPCDRLLRRALVLAACPAQRTWSSRKRPSGARGAVCVHGARAAVCAAPGRAHMPHAAAACMHGWQGSRGQRLHTAPPAVPSPRPGCHLC
jgi:hypothetical protein